MGKIFISFSHEDEKWKNRLTGQLNCLAPEGHYCVWDDSRITTGGNWRAEIETALNEAAVAILLISHDFINSEFIRKDEIPVILKRREEEGMKVISLFVRPCPWKEIDWLKGIQGIPTDNTTLQDLEDKNQIAAYERILSELASELKKLLSQLPLSPAGINKPIPILPSNSDSNPFTEVGIIKDFNRFVGRNQDLNKIMSYLKDGSSISLVGESKIGKSSLLYRLANYCGLKTPGRFGFQFQSWEEIQGAIITWTGVPGNTLNSFRDALLKIDGVVFLDEMDVAAEKGMKKGDGQLLRSILQENRRLRLITASQDKLKNITELTGRGSDWYNILMPLTLEPFDENDARLLLNHPWMPNALLFDETTIQNLLHISVKPNFNRSCLNGRIYHPFLLQRAAFHCFDMISGRDHEWKASFKNDMESML